MNFKYNVGDIIRIKEWHIGNLRFVYILIAERDISINNHSDYNYYTYIIQGRPGETYSMFEYTLKELEVTNKL
jgi:hypothetical protein